MAEMQKGGPAEKHEKGGVGVCCTRPVQRGQAERQGDKKENMQAHARRGKVRGQRWLYVVTIPLLSYMS